MFAGPPGQPQRQGPPPNQGPHGMVGGPPGMGGGPPGMGGGPPGMGGGPPGMGGGPPGGPRGLPPGMVRIAFFICFWIISQLIQSIPAQLKQQ